MLSDLQKKKLLKVFSAFDQDRNELLEKADFDRISTNIAEVHGHKPGSPKHAAIKEKYMGLWSTMLEPMSDGGKFKKDAWLAFHEKMLTVPGAYDTSVRVVADFLFDILDDNGDGKISLEETRRFFKAYGLGEENAETTFKKSDLNKDGHISKNELQDLVSQFYFSSDPDAPGNWLFGPL